MDTSELNNNIRKLNKDLEEAIEILLPYFAINSQQKETFRKPITIVLKNTSGSSYNMEKAEFTFREKNKYDPSSIGEEASHYIHGEINPFYKNKNIPKYGEKLFFEGANLIELVGRYGALIYCKQKGFPVEPVNWNELINSGKGLFIGMTHYQGYSRAEKIFTKHGAALLPKIARMSIAEAQQKLPKIAPIGFYEMKVLPFIEGLGKQINGWR